MYARKHPVLVLPGAPPETVAMVDVGRLQTTVVVANFGGPAAGAAAEGAGTDESGAADAKGNKPSAAAAAVCSYSVLAVRSDEDLGAFNFDNKMFRHFQGVVSHPDSQPARAILLVSLPTERAAGSAATGRRTCGTYCTLLALSIQYIARGHGRGGRVSSVMCRKLKVCRRVPSTVATLHNHFRPAVRLTAANGDGGRGPDLVVFYIVEGLFVLAALLRLASLSIARLARRGFRAALYPLFPLSRLSRFLR